MPKRNMTKSQVMYKGYISPSFGNLPKPLKTYGSHVYTACREGTPKESEKAKSLCAAVTWKQIHKKQKEMKK